MKQMHFSPDEWQAYKSKSLEPKVAAELEAHLRHCEDCQEYYLRLFDEEDLKAVINMVPLDFTDTLLDKIQPPPLAPVKPQTPPGRKKLDRRSLMAYYVTSAGLTLALMGGGVFDFMVDQSMQISQKCMLQTQNIESKVSRGWNVPLLENGPRLMEEILIEKERNEQHAK